MFEPGVYFLPPLLLLLFALILFLSCLRGGLDGDPRELFSKASLLSGAGLLVLFDDVLIKPARTELPVLCREWVRLLVLVAIER